MHDLVAAGSASWSWCASDGEASHPRARTTPDWLARCRREECRSGLAPAGRARVVFLGLADGGVGVPRPAPSWSRSTGCSTRAPRPRPVDQDGHPDHERLGAAAAARPSGSVRALWFYPIWLWHWADESGLPWNLAATFSPSATALHAKEAAIRCHRSQVEALGQGEGEAPVLTETGLGPSRRVVETLFRGGADRGDSDDASAAPPPDGRVFDAMFENDVDDPWGFESSWYEARKRALTGCRAGARALRLGPRHRLLDRRAHGRAGLAGRPRHRRRRQCGRPEEGRHAVARPRAGVELVHGSTGSDLPRTTYDLVVLSEVGYFLAGGGSCWPCCDGCAACSRPTGRSCSATGSDRPEDVPLDGPLVHRQARAALDLPLAASYADADLLLDVWRLVGLGRCARGARVTQLLASVAVGVVPARDEQDLLPLCLDSVRVAEAELALARPDVACEVIVVLDVVHGRDRLGGDRSWGQGREQLAPAGSVPPGRWECVRRSTAASRPGSGSPTPTPTPWCLPTGWYARRSWPRPATTWSTAPSSPVSPTRTPTCWLDGTRATCWPTTTPMSPRQLRHPGSIYGRLGGFEHVATHEDLRLVTRAARRGRRDRDRAIRSEPPAGWWPVPPAASRAISEACTPPPDVRHLGRLGPHRIMEPWRPPAAPAWPAQAGRNRRRLLRLAAWVLEILDTASGHRLDAYGVQARTDDGLVGVVVAPTLHFGFDHLVGDTVPVLVLGFLVLAAGAPVGSPRPR